MKKLGSFFCLWFFVLQVNASMTNNINNTVRHIKRTATVGIDVVNLQGQPVYNYHSTHRYVPASNAKIYVALASLLYLGPNYRFSTKLLASTNQVNDNTLKGDLYLDYSGDPSLKYQNLLSLFQRLQAMHVKHIDGNFYYDVSAFDQDNHAPGWNRNDFPYCFSAPINAVIVNRNCISYMVQPGRRHGHRLRARGTSNDFQFLSFINNGITGLSRGGCSPLRTSVLANNSITVRGCLLVNSRAKYFSHSVNNINDYNVAIIKSLLREYGIQLNGNIEQKTITHHLELIAHHESQTLYTLLYHMMKKSDDLYAAAMFKKVGQRYYHTTATWKNSAEAVKNIIYNQLHVNISRSIIMGGSGLSHVNQISPAKLTAVLLAAYHDKDISHYFIKVLPIAGVDGTLKYRMRSSSIRHSVSAKTGSLRGVSSLSGYIKTRHHGVLVFSIMINDFSGSLYPYRALQDKILRYLRAY